MGTNGTHSMCIRRKERAVLLPVTNIIPAKIGGYNDKVFRLLQDTVINRNRGQSRPDFIDRRCFLRRSHSTDNDIYFLHQFRKMGTHFSQNSPYFPDEYSAIP